MRNTDTLAAMLMMIIEGLRKSGKRYVKTIDVIRILNGQFFSDLNTPVCRSWNAAIGRALSSNSEMLSIDYDSKVRVKDDSGHRTKSAVWKLW